MLRLIRRILASRRYRRIEADLAEELEVHCAMRQRDFEAAGLTPEEAAHASRRALGNLTLAREDARAVWIWPWLESIWQDTVYALRVLRRAPAFAAAIVLVMALGIGATTGVFSLLDGLVLRSLTVSEPERLVYFTRPSFSYPIFEGVSASSGHIFASFSAWNMESANVQWNDELEPTEVLAASGNFYRTLGISAIAGRVLGPEDDRIGGGQDGPVAVISYGCWQQRFGGKPGAIGRTIRIDRRPFTIVGVTPPGFFGVTPGLVAEVTIPLTVLSNEGALRSHGSSWLHLLGRLRDGLTIEQADAALQAFWPVVREAASPLSMPAERRKVFLSRQTNLASARVGYSRVRNQFEEPLWILLALVGLLMTVACASAANLLLARGVARRREISVRLAIGASRARVIRQMLTEAAVWTTLAAIVGIVLAAWGATALIAMMSTHESRIVMDVTPNSRIAGFAVALGFVTIALSAVIPALRTTRLDLALPLKTAVASGGLLRRWTFLKALVGVQVALTIVLLVSAAVLVRSLDRLLSEDTGFDRDRVLVLATDAEAAGYEGERLNAYYDQLLERLRAVPSVESVSLSEYPPISDEDGAWTQAIDVDSAAAPDPAGAPDIARSVHFNAVTPDYFRTIGMRIIRGRDFGRQDSVSSSRVVAINETLSRRFFPGDDPIGRHITIGRHAARRNMEIVAVVSDAKYQRMDEPPRSIAYLARAQIAGMPSDANLFAEVRAARPDAALAESVRRAVRSLDARVPLRIETVSDRIRQSLVRERLMALLAATLGLAALILACAALYGLLAYAVSRQSYEIGLRLALGAQRRSILWRVLGECLMLALLGTTMGLCASLVLGRYVQTTLLYQITPADSIAMGAAALIMIAVASLAGAIPARRAARVDPAVALRVD